MHDLSISNANAACLVNIPIICIPFKQLHMRGRFQSYLRATTLQNYSNNILVFIPLVFELTLILMPAIISKFLNTFHSTNYLFYSKQTN